MAISKRMLGHYLSVVAINLGLMNQKLAESLARYDKATFASLLQARIDELEAESKSDTAFFPPEYYADGIDSMTYILSNLDHILSEAA